MEGANSGYDGMPVNASDRSSKSILNEHYPRAVRHLTFSVIPLDHGLLCASASVATFLLSSSSLNFAPWYISLLSCDCIALDRVYFCPVRRIHLNPASQAQV